MNWQRVVLGIGNPGAEYEGTRHNIGFMVLDRVAERLGLTFTRLERRAPDGARLFSGKVKARIAEALFVVVDDLNLPLGRIRVRPAGSSGGHNGLRSIEAAVGSSGYPRLRLGIGVPQSTSSVDHVLAPFEQEERGVLGQSIESAVEATCQWLQGVDLQTLMERFNPDRTEPSEPTEPLEP
ncbi:MAG: aminoacyl-tRNA hydrolase [Planctomycetota bacterium]|jgi:PTH1 family peptidyl-tRNA hydrolase